VTALVETWKKPGNLEQWPGYKEAAALLDTIKLSAVPWNFRGAELYDALQQGMDRAWTGKMDFKAALDDTAKSMRQVLEQPVS
jgi:ABC-type glycerol-3-phosphate transport system substrate-binding protein